MRLAPYLACLLLCACSSSSTNESGAGGVAGAGGGGTGATGGAAGASGGGTGGASTSITCSKVDAMTCCSTSEVTSSWSTASNHCTGLGLQLVKIEDGTKNLAVADAVTPLNVWIGLTDADTEGSFKWVDGAQLGTYAPWSSLGTEPNSAGSTGGNQDCVYVNSLQVWADTDCKGNLPTVRGFCCE